MYENLKGKLEAEEVHKMKKIVVTALCLAIILSLGIILWNHNQWNVNEVVDVLNEATSHYGDMNTNNDKTFSLRVDDMQILLITYAPSYSLLGVSTKEYIGKPEKPSEVFDSEKELWSPICNYDNALIYDEETNKYYNVSFSGTENPAIPIFEKAKELK